MPLVAVCGIPGAGKSTICASLKELGHDALDTDLDGFSCWRDAESKLPVPEPADWHDPVATAGIECAVRRDRVADLRTRADGEDHVIYLCGFAGGEDEYWDLFDRMIQVAVDNETLRDRLATRTTNTYGKAAHERDGILAANLGWADSYRSRGAIVIDGTLPLDEVVAAVVAAGEEGWERPFGEEEDSRWRCVRRVRRRRSPPDSLARPRLAVSFV